MLVLVFVLVRSVGDAENARLEKAGLENPGPNCYGGKGGTGKRGTLKVWKA